MWTESFHSLRPWLNKEEKASWDQLAYTDSELPAPDWGCAVTSYSNSLPRPTYRGPLPHARHHFLNFPSSTPNAMKLVNPLVEAEFSSSNHFPKSLPLNTAAWPIESFTCEPLGDTSYPNQDSQVFTVHKCCNRKLRNAKVVRFEGHLGVSKQGQERRGNQSAWS